MKIAHLNEFGSLFLFSKRKIGLPYLSRNKADRHKAYLPKHHHEGGARSGSLRLVCVSKPIAAKVMRP